MRISEKGDFVSLFKPMFGDLSTLSIPCTFDEQRNDVSPTSVLPHLTQ